ncbi:hypothetical protein DBV05_g4043 [Lasiodiplodia theobromae]|uniref:Protein kinase domain-containing protein n=1 Tax=Lasiodiplodia theobromae TaxID=45133 RepID=A0A5N5DK94_9PEZI|nr:hypothetical protein DBV05_g4043 [Lasiodiplodia theobromae]
MGEAHLDRELHQEFHDWIKTQTLRGIGAPDLAANPSYVPQQRIDEYFKADKNIGQILQRLDPDGNLKVYQNTIVQKYSKVFCTLLLIGQGHHIETFVRHFGLCDLRLPFEQKPEHFPIGDDGVDFFERFKAEQWQFCAQPLTYNMNLVYEDAQILPIMTKDRIGDGGSSDIFKITLHQAYDELDPRGSAEKKNPSFRHAHTYVLKTYRTRDARKYYNNETTAFRRVLAAASNQSTVPGLIGFHGNFIHGGTHNVLLEYADKGTLEQYFQEVPPPTTEEDIVSFWRGLFYPIFALLKIHNLEGHDLENPSLFHGWHQDIKPDNILVVSSDRQSPYKYEFKLADLGLSHFKKPRSPNRETTDNDTYGTRTYGAPESYRSDHLIGPANLRVTKSVDIWSLGSVYSESATWLVLGKEGLEQYRADRKAETDKIRDFKDHGCFHDGEKILESVESTHIKIVASKRKTDHITRNVLETMVQDMLGEENVRPNAQQLWLKSQRLLRQANDARQNSKWSSTTESPTSSRNPTLTQEPPVGGSVAPQDRSTSISRRSTRTGHGNFTGENKRIEHSPERMSTDSPDNESPPNIDTPVDTRDPGRPESWFRAQSLVYRPKPNPEWSVDAAWLWKETQRNRKFMEGKTAPEGGERYMDLINERDHVFIVDDSDSMRNADWSTLTTRFSLLSYIVKVADPDGLDLYFSSSVDPIHSKKSSELTGAVTKRRLKPVGRDNLVRVLEAVLQAFRASMFGSGRNKGRLGKKSSKRGRPMTCYILTDGAWFAEHGPGVEAVIKKFVDELLRKVAQETDFGIEFISFGDHHEGLDFLEYLDSGLHLERDIIDTEPANGDVWKMLLGSINKTFDKVNDKQIELSIIDTPATRRSSVFPPTAATNTYGRVLDC